jgi:hypothetical protein
MRRASKIAGFAALLALALTAGPLTGSASAAACNVPGTKATVQEAIDDGSCDPIVVAAGTFNGSFVVNRGVTILGAGAGQTVLAGTTGSTTFDADAGPGGTIAASGLTITHSPAATGAGVGVQTDVTLNLSNTVVSGNTNSDGGGVFVSGGTLNLTRGSIVSNTSTGPALGGAGIQVSNGVLNLADSTVSGNRSTNASGGEGGGVAVTGDSSVLSLTNTTISGNSTNTFGGGLEDAAASSVTLTNVTVANNTADADGNGSGDGGGIYIEPSTPVQLRNTLVANNTDPGGQAPDCGTTLAGGQLTRLGYVLLRSQAGCTLGGTGDDATGYQTGVDPLLGPLAANGGPTQTMALLAGSPAIDAIPVASCAVATDQRGVSRPQGSGCDIGAFELAAPPSNPALPSNAFRFGKLKRNKKKGIAFLIVFVPGPGQVGLAGKGIKRFPLASTAAARKSIATAGGRVKLKVKPAKKGKKARKLRHALNRKGKAKVKVRVTYLPTGGTANTRARKVKLIKRRG